MLLERAQTSCDGEQATARQPGQRRGLRITGHRCQATKHAMLKRPELSMSSLIHTPTVVCQQCSRVLSVSQAANHGDSILASYGMSPSSPAILTHPEEGACSTRDSNTFEAYA